jgi:hypothetical protein
MVPFETNGTIFFYVIRLKFVKNSTEVGQRIIFFPIFATSSEGSGQRRGATRERRNDRV